MAGNGKTAAAELDPFGDLQLPSELQPGLLRHREHLAQLVASLQTVGINEAQIEDSVSILVASYKDELTLTMKRMVKQR